MIHEKNIDQLKSEVQYIQEVRTPFLGGREHLESLNLNLGGSLFSFSAPFVLLQCPWPPMCHIHYLFISTCYLFSETGPL